MSQEMLDKLLIFVSLLIILFIPEYHLHSISFKLRIVVFILLFILLFYDYCPFISKFINKLGTFIYNMMNYKFSSFFMIFFLFILLYNLRVDTSIGDGHGEWFGQGTFLTQDPAIDTGLDVEFLSLTIPHSTTYFLRNVLGLTVSGEQVLVTLNLLWGAIGLFYLLKISRELFSPSSAVFLLIFISGGYVEMFFGYNEDYTQPTVLTIIYIYYMLKSSSKPQLLTIASIILGLIIASHSTLVTLYGGLVFFFLFNNVYGSFIERVKKLAYYTLITFSTYFSLLVFYYLAGMKFNMANIYLSHHTSQTMLFSASHYWGILDQLLTLSGISVIFIALFFIFNRFKDPKEPILYFFTGSLLGYFMFMIIYRYSFGVSGTWPMLSPGGALLTLFAAWLVNTYFKEPQKDKILYILILMNLFFFIPLFLYGRTYICQLLC